MEINTADESIPVLIFRIMVGFIAVIGNGVILYIALRFNNFRSSICNCLIALLAFGEFILGFGIMIRAFYSIYIATLNITSYNRFKCMAITLPQIFGVVFGQTIMLSMAIDRFMAVRKPTEYYKSNSKKPIFITSFVAFILACFFSVLSLWNLEDTPPLQCSSGGAANVIFIKLWEIFTIIVAVLIFAVYISMIFLLICRTKVLNLNMAMSLKRQRKVLASISLILLSYALFWCLPLFISSMLYNFFTDPVLQGYISLIVGLCAGMNSCVGLFIYLAKHQEIKENFQKILPKFARFDQKQTRVTEIRNFGSMVRSTRTNF